MLNHIEQRTQVPKTYAVIGVISFLALLHLVNSLAAIVSNIVGWALPAYLSFKAIESPSPHDDVQWLTYWVVFGFFNFLESFASSLVLYYIPWYYTLKTLFIIWLQLPAFRVRIPVFLRNLIKLFLYRVHKPPILLLSSLSSPMSPPRPVLHLPPPRTLCTRNKSIKGHSC